VLVVEDDLTARRAIMMILRTQGFAASEAPTVAEAIRKLRERRPEWVLLDLMLPDGYGTEVQREIRTAAEDGETVPRVCVITGCGGHLVTESRLLGAEQVLTKPLDVERLLELLNAAPVG
jgi:DNA-binding response OmpR family regulator